MDGFRRTKIVATLGPASSDKSTLRQMIDAGVDVVRLNFSHGDLHEKEQVIATVREIEGEAGRPVAILQDIQGPKIRVGAIRDEPVHLEAGSTLAIHGDGREGNATAISTTYGELANEVGAGDSIFLDDGAIELRVIDAEQGVVRCQVIVGGEISSSKGVNLPGVRLSVSALTDKDRQDLRFGVEHGVDYVALSFVRSPGDAAEARAVMQEAGHVPPLLAKIEKREAVEHMASILRTFDGSMVARGDLGVELRPEKVPGVQKQIIARSIALARPVITATQMLESMTYNRRATRAEASDVANAVLDGSHAVMLSGETAIGRHPVEVVRAMHRIVVEAERLMQPMPLDGLPVRSAAQSVCRAAAQLAAEVDATALAAFTRSGGTAHTLSSLQPGRPIIAFCETLAMARSLCLWRGVKPIVIGPGRSGESAGMRMEREMSARGLFESGNRVVSVGAAPGSRAGQTNFIRLHRL